MLKRNRLLSRKHTVVMGTII